MRPARHAPRRALEQLVVGHGAEAPPRGGHRVEPLLDLLEAAGVCVECGDERAQVGACVAQAQIDVAQLLGDAGELGRDRGERLERALGVRDELAAPSPSSGARAVGHGRALAQLGRRAGRARARPAARPPRRLEVARVLDERAQLRERAPRAPGVPRRPRPAARARPRARARRRALAPRGSAPTNASSTASWNAGRASRRCSNCPDIAIKRSAAAATSSRATLRPQA